MTTVPSFRYRALTANGELTSGTISAASVAEVARRLEARGLFYVDDGAGEERRASSSSSLAFLNSRSARPMERITVGKRFGPTAIRVTTAMTTISKKPIPMAVRRSGPPDQRTPC